MKIGILTQPLQSNYGGILQNYALQQVLIGAGHKVETIDWGLRKDFRRYAYECKMAVKSFVNPEKYTMPPYMPTGKEQEVICRNLNAFTDTYIHRTPKIFSAQGFRKQADEGGYDAYVVGSDQCWRPRYNRFLDAMFLDFVREDNVKRIAYAASFGTDKWEFSPARTSTCARLAQRFDFVSVREDSGVKLCRDHLGIEAAHVLDPTMLLTAEDYVALVRKDGIPQSKGKLFNYILDPDERINAFIRRIAQYKGLEAFRVLPIRQQENRTKYDVRHHIEDCVFPGVGTWLRAFMDAEMTIVDSFHGMVFSILFNKPFWVIGNATRGMSRFTSLLKEFGLEDRMLDVEQLDNVQLDKAICWKDINARLEQRRIKCKKLLLESLNCVIICPKN